MVLVVEDDIAILRFLSGYLSQHFPVFTASTKEEAERVFREKMPKCVILDLLLPREEDGFYLLQTIKGIDFLTKVIVITGAKEYALEAIKMGAFDFFEKPFDELKLLISCQRALRMYELEKKILEEREEKGFLGIIGVSDKILKIFETIEKIAPYDINVLIVGESGTGKELIARAIHQKSGRKGDFVALNCSAIPETLLEAELFGYEKGAFTGASSRSPGKIELAENGTLFLDEISEMKKEIMPKLLRVLEYKEYWPVGGKELKKTNSRFIFATNKNIEELVRRGEFREDLYYRIGQIVIYVPPLRERREDIPALVWHFIKISNARYGKNVMNISDKAMDFLMSYNYPGNVRELKNIIERAVVMSKGNEITLEDIRFGITPKIGVTPIDAIDDGSNEMENLTLREYISFAEKSFIERVLRKNGFNIKKSAEELGISRPSLYFLIKKYGIKID